jgi:sarcosine oxidase subunit beta
MVRSAFGSEEYIRLYHKSLKLWETLSAELDFNVMFSRNGYLVLATTPAELDSYRPHVETQKRYGLNTRILEAREVSRLVPDLNRELAAGGMFQAEAGSARHDAVVWAYARAARRLGVELFPATEVTDVVVKSGSIETVKTTKGDIQTQAVVNAAGAFCAQHAAMVKVDLPVHLSAGNEGDRTAQALAAGCALFPARDGLHAPDRAGGAVRQNGEGLPCARICAGHGSIYNVG